MGVEGLAARLRAAGCVYAEDEAALLLAEARDGEHLETLVRARVDGRPLEQVLGWAEFAGIRVRLDPGVFVPRRRTALLVDLADDAARAAGPGATLVDLCCGSGALAAALLARRTDLSVWATDLDPTAVACARRNLPGLPPGRIRHGDLYGALPPGLRGGIDVLVVNAPYVPSAHVEQLPAEARDHEPPTALDGGADGLAIHRRVAAGAVDWLRPGGVLLIEVAETQVPSALAILRDDGLGLEAVAERDEDRDATAVRARRPVQRIP